MTRLTWLITGCSSGFGEELAKSILKRGDRVIATARDSVNRLKDLRDLGATTLDLDVCAPQADINNKRSTDPIKTLIVEIDTMEFRLQEEPPLDMRGWRENTRGVNPAPEQTREPKHLGRKQHYTHEEGAGWLRDNGRRQNRKHGWNITKCRRRRTGDSQLTRQHGEESEVQY